MRKKIKKIRLAIENMASAVAYAEQGQREEALRLVDELAPLRESSHAKVILASTQPAFSDAALSYMRGMVERMPCDVLALTSEPRRLGAGPPGEMDGASITALQGLVQGQGAICLHRTFSGGLCESIQHACQLIRDFRFAVIQAQGDGLPACSLPIPVFLVRA